MSPNKVSSTTTGGFGICLCLIHSFSFSTGSPSVTLDGSIYSNYDFIDLAPTTVVLGSSPTSAAPPFSKSRLPRLNSAESAAVMAKCSTPTGRFKMVRVHETAAPTVDIFEKHLLKSWDGSQISQLSESISSDTPRFISMYFDDSIPTEYQIEKLIWKNRRIDLPMTKWDSLSAPPVLSEGSL